MDKDIANSKETIEGYEIEQVYTFKDNKGIALAVNRSFFCPYITCQYTVSENGTRDYYWLHHFLCEHSARKDFCDRTIDRMKSFDGRKHENYRYYAIRQRIVYNTYPKPDGDPTGFVCFEKPAQVENGSFKAWGYMEYDKPLAEKVIKEYGLRAAPANPVISENQIKPKRSDRGHER